MRHLIDGGRRHRPTKREVGANVEPAENDPHQPGMSACNHQAVGMPTAGCLKWQSPASPPLYASLHPEVGSPVFVAQSRVLQSLFLGQRQKLQQPLAEIVHDVKAKTEAIRAVALRA